MSDICIASLVINFIEGNVQVFLRVFLFNNQPVKVSQDKIVKSMYTHFKFIGSWNFDLIKK